MPTFDSWRLQVNFENRTGRSLPPTGPEGATVIRSHRGTKEPVRFSPGQTQRILNLLGEPTPSRPDVIEVITFNGEYPIWVSAPAGKGAMHGGVHFTKTGVEPLTGGVSTLPDTYEEWPVTEKLGKGDGSETNFSMTVSDYEYYVPQSIVVLKDSEELDGFAVTVNEGIEELSDSDGGTGSFDPSDGSFEYTFNEAPESKVKLEVFYKTDRSENVYFTLLSKGPQDDVFGVLAEYDDENDKFEIDFQLKGRRGEFNTVADAPWTVSLDEGATDDTGQSIYIENVLDDNDWVVVKTNEELYEEEGVDDQAWSDAESLVEFNGGARGEDPEAADMIDAYRQFHQVRKYPADVFFDASAHPEIADEFDTIRNSFQKYSRFILPLPNVDADQALEDAETLGLDNRGISLYWNWGKVRNRFSTRGNVWTPLTGHVALRHAEIIDNAFGGIAPAWTMENGMGGVLPPGIEEMAYDPDQNTLQTLFNEGINAIIEEPGLGVILSSERTTQNAINDDAFISHSGAKDYAVKTILNNVVPFQLVKFNDTAHRDVVTNKTTQILEPMTVPPRNVLRNFHVRCDETNNTDEVLARDEFILTVAIQVTPMSRWFIFNVINSAQGADVEEDTE